MLLEMTEEGSAAYQLVYSVGPGNGSQAWALLRQEFSQQRPTEQMMVLTQFRKPVRQKPGESVTQYMLNVQTRFKRLEQLVPDAKKRWDLLQFAKALQGVQPELAEAAFELTEDAAREAMQNDTTPDLNIRKITQYLQAAADNLKYQDSQTRHPSTREAYLAEAESESDSEDANRAVLEETSTVIAGCTDAQVRQPSARRPSRMLQMYMVSRG